MYLSGSGSGQFHQNLETVLEGKNPAASQHSSPHSTTVITISVVTQSRPYLSHLSIRVVAFYILHAHQTLTAKEGRGKHETWPLHAQLAAHYIQD